MLWCAAPQDPARHARRRTRRAFRRLRRRHLHQCVERRRDLSALAPFDERAARGLSADRILADLRKRLAAIQDAFIITISPPPVRGIGTAGGFKMMVQDKRGRGFPSLEAATQEIVTAANQVPGLVGVFSSVQHPYPEGLCRYRPGARRDARRTGQPRLRDPAGLSRARPM